ncbi:MAG TPA: DUF2341 domain-containing protein [Polyangiaceae bacterium]|jgi:hypothetical protein
MRRSLPLLVLFSAPPLWTIGCTHGDDNLNIGEPDAAFDFDAAQSFDVSSPRVDAGSKDTGVDATADTSVPDASIPDTSVPDTSVADTSVADSNVADTNVPDADASEVDASDAGADASDANTLDAGPPDAGTCVIGDGGSLDCNTIVVDVANAGSRDLTGYTVPIALDTRPYVAASALKSDCSDLSAYDADHTTPLPYWVSTNECNAALTKVFVKVPSIPAGGAARIYLRFGAPPALTPDPDSLFPFFDGFDGTQIDTTKWTHYGDGTATVASGLLTTQHANLLNGTSNVVLSKTRTIGLRINAQSAFGDDYEIGAGTVTGVSSPSWLWVQARTGQWVSFVSYSAANMLISSGSTFCSNDNVLTTQLFDGTWRDVEFNYDLESTTVSVNYQDLAGKSATHSDGTDAGCVPAASEPVILGLDHGTGSGNDPVAQVDWVYVRDVASPEPTVVVTPPAWVGAGGGSDAGVGDAAGD